MSNMTLKDIARMLEEDEISGGIAVGLAYALGKQEAKDEEARRPKPCPGCATGNYCKIHDDPYY